MLKRALLVMALCGALPASALAQSIELVYTPGVVNDAVTLKNELKGAVVHASSALGMVGASADKKKQYKDQVAGATCILIMGEDALKALADIEFESTLVLVNANGRTAARGRVIRLFDGSVQLPAGTVQIETTDQVRELVNAGREVKLRGRPLAPIVRAVLAALGR